MTQEEAIDKLRKYQEDCDTELAHITADTVLCYFLRSLGYADVADEWEKIEPKWYA